AELAISDRLEVYEESIKPPQDIQWAIEHYGTGRFTPRPILFRPFSLSPAEYQIFGVPLEEQLVVSHKDIPLFPAKALSLIRKASRDMEPADRYKIWTTRTLLKNIHELRNSVNRGSRVTLKHLREFDLTVVANTLVLYLLELPRPLCPDEIYDPLRAVYGSRSEKDSSVDALQSISHLLQGINYVHLKTLQVLFGTINEQIQGDVTPEREEFVRAVSQRLGPVILRAREIVGVTVNRLPEHFARDLIENYDVVLANLQIERPAKPTVQPAKPQEDVGELTRSMANMNAGGSVPVGVAGPSAMASPRTSLEKPRMSLSADDAKIKSVNASNRVSTSSSLHVPADDAQKAKPSFDDDEVSIDSILEESNDANHNSESMDFFLKDEDSDGTDDDEDSDEDSAI
ncbi:Rho-GTPase-activating protein 8, partial [Linderina macrospora]